MRPLQNRFSAILLKAAMLVMFAAVLVAAPVAGADLQQYLTAPVWYLEFEVSFKARYADSVQNGVTKTKTTISLDRVFSAMWPLDLRTDGLSPVLSPSSLSNSANGSVPTMAEQQKMIEDMMARMNNAANWMSSGGALTIDEDATLEEAQAATEAGMKAAMGPCKLEYLRVDVGTNLFNEMGDPYDQTTRTTRKGTGTVWPGGGQSITFEIDGVSKKFQLMLPQSFHDMTAKLQQNVIVEQGLNGEMHVESQDRSEFGLAFYPKELTIDDPNNMQAGMALVRGNIDPASSKIAGESSVAAHYNEDGVLSVAGTLTFRYTLSLTPPAKGSAKGK